MTDRHYTPPELALAIVARLVNAGDLLPGDRVLDPCVGKGAFSNAVRALCPDAKLRTIDEDPEVDADIHDDFLAVPARGTFDLVVSNPPFSLGQRFVEKSIGMCEPRGCVAFLLLVQFLGSVGRREFFEQYPPTSVEVIRPRPSFSDDGGSDMREYALFRWHPRDFEVLRKRPRFIDWEKPRKSRESKERPPPPQPEVDDHLLAIPGVTP